MYIEDIKEDNLWLMKGDCLERMQEIADGSIDLTVTSPPYDNLRTYNDTLDWREHDWQCFDGSEVTPFSLVSSEQ